MNSETSRIAQNICAVKERIAIAAGKAGRDQAGVRLVAVSKTFPAESVVAAIDAGLLDFGESRVQEAAPKIESVSGMRPDACPRWHMVGRLQKNKVKYIIDLVGLIHSVESVELAGEIARQTAKRARNRRETEILLQVNVSGETAKQGFAQGDLISAAGRIKELPGVKVRGLMTIPPFSPDPESARRYYIRLRELGAELAEIIPDAAELSMGMSGDYEVAVEEGATLVRVGTAIFGAR